MTLTPYSSATELLKALHHGRVSSRDLLEQQLDRIQQHNPTLNAVIALDADNARRRADEADTARKRGERWGLLHGLPITIKDSYEVVGMPTTAGAPELREYQSPQNATAVQRLLKAGAIILGKTNLPYYAGDVQSFNDLHGTTNNPWDVKRTPGGSSGGAATAVAVGFTPLELGSDVGGSIRIPAHYCGVYGHKSTHGLIPMHGHIPGPPGTTAEPDLAVAGPLARTPEDLRLMFDVLVGPRDLDAVGWQLRLPPPRTTDLRKFRVAYWFEDPACPVDEIVLDKLYDAVDALRVAGAQVRPLAPHHLTLADINAIYMPMLLSLMAVALPDAAYKAVERITPALKRMPTLFGLPPNAGEYIAAMSASYRDWLVWNELRDQLRHRMASFFQDIDVLLMPVAPVTAIPHDHNPNIIRRKIMVNDHAYPYLNQLGWIGLATAVGLPATSAPVGIGTNGLPVNIQIVGPQYADYTTFAFATALAQRLGGFTPPPLFA
jgi:amidase